MDSRKFLSPDERSHLETYLTSRVETDTRNAAMLLTALHSGARPTELLNLEWSEINIATGAIYIRTLKRGRPREVVVPKVVRHALERLKSTGIARPFDISYSRFAEIWNEYRPSPTKTLRCLRHSFAMRAYERTRDIRFVQRAIGHKSLTNTQIYLEYDYSATEFKKMMRLK